MYLKIILDSKRVNPVSVARTSEQSVKGYLVAYVEEGEDLTVSIFLLLWRQTRPRQTASLFFASMPNRAASQESILGVYPIITNK